MRANEFARLARARRAGQDKWIGRCPAHNDRNPSLSIAVGKDGRVLIHCFAGCTHRAILEALGLQERDLFSGSKCERADCAAVERVIREQHLAATALNQTRGALSDEYRRLSQVVDALGAKLARNPDAFSGGNAMTQLFHNALERLRAVEAELDRERK